MEDSRGRAPKIGTSKQFLMALVRDFTCASPGTRFKITPAKFRSGHSDDLKIGRINNSWPTCLFQKVIFTPPNALNPGVLKPNTS